MQKNAIVCSLSKFIFLKAIAQNLKAISFFLITIALSVNAYSEGTKINLQFQDSCSLKKIIEEIEKTSNFIFIYNTDIVDVNIKRTIIAKGERIEPVLDRLFEGTKLAYKISDRQVLLYPKTVPKELYQFNSKTKSENQQKQKHISGCVTDKDKIPIVGVTVLVKDTHIGVTTDADGKFELTVPSIGATLVFTFVGMQTQEVIVGTSDIYNVILYSSNVTLDEIVVIGYGIQKKVSVTGSISSVTSADIKQSPTSSIANTLTGRISGFATVQLGGQPGVDDPKIFIRGIGSLTQDNSVPLMMVDGVERSFTRLDPDEIESVSVLKDASATAVYGVRGANGVIIVTTKRGKIGKPQINVSTNFGIEKPVHLLKFIDSYTTAITFNESQINDNPNAVLKFTPEAIEAFRTNSDPIIYPNLDWIKYLLKPYSFNSKHNINISGGNETVKYFVSLGYRNENGLWKKLYSFDNNFWYDQYNLRTNLDINLSKTTTLSFTTSNKVGVTNKPYNSQDPSLFFRRMYWGQPYASPGIIDGKQIVTGSQIPGQIKTGNDIDGGCGKVTTYDDVMNFDINLNQKLDFVTKGLGFKCMISYNYEMIQSKSRTIDYARYYAYPLYFFEPSASAETRMTPAYQKLYNTSVLRYSESNSKAQYWYTEIGFNYDRIFGNHSLTGLLLYNESKRYYPNSYPDIPSGYVGIVGRVTYNYKSKYFLDLNAGYNGSENFAKGKRFGLFPAISAGWILTEENFMKMIPFVNYLKVRGSYGLVGNDQIGGRRFLFLPDTYNANSGGYNFGTSVPENQITASENTLGNPFVTWEKSRKQNYGFDLKILKGNLRFSFDKFYEYRYDILITRNTTPAFFPVTLPAVNLGRVSNKGFEVEAEWRQNIRSFGYYIGFNLSKAKNKILFNDELQQPEPYLERTGKSVGQTFGYIWDGFWREEDIANISNFPTNNYVPHPGDMRYKDLNNDGIVNANDQMAIGYPINPIISGGIRGGINYKNLDVSMLWSGTSKTSRLLEGVMRLPFEGTFRNTLQWLVDGRWTPETAETATLPRFSIAGNADYNYNRTSDFWMRDASYLRLKNAEIGYNILNISRLGISKMRIYINGYNLLTFSKMKMTDPEAESGANQLYPLMKIYNIGVNVAFK